MPLQLDENGQPPRPFYQARVAERAISELLGVCKGMVCDGVITAGEAAGLRRWMQANPDAAEQFPGNVLADRFMRIFADGRVDSEEQAELLELLREVTGEPASMDEPMNLSTRLPLDAPPPSIVFEGQEYVFTGKMLYGTRRLCEQTVAERGGRAHNAVTKRTDYLVIGHIGSAAWKESTHGTKIVRAVELKAEGSPVRIVSEECWVAGLA
jgi:NAD-dependent DNA ligase